MKHDKSILENKGQWLANALKDEGIEVYSLETDGEEWVSLEVRTEQNLRYAQEYLHSTGLFTFAKAHSLRNGNYLLRMEVV